MKSLFDDDYRKRTGDGTTAGGNTLMSVINDLKGYGLDDEAAQQIAASLWMQAATSPT
ncbi:hypothetical protein [Vitreoscilla filiformis]|uniref:hypothetical protein n=1 Tax=Vitreoscilla filiformis TaxID=63 RepID=UPI0012FD7AD1|nr:hypothetical protein [Vitreoscilla filiformis]